MTPDDRPDLFELTLIGAGFASILVVGPLALAAVGETRSAGLVASAAWSVTCGYESQLIPELKTEFARRLP